MSDDHDHGDEDRRPFLVDGDLLDVMSVAYTISVSQDVRDILLPKASELSQRVLNENGPPGPEWTTLDYQDCDEHGGNCPDGEACRP